MCNKMVKVDLVVTLISTLKYGGDIVLQKYEKFSYIKHLFNWLICGYIALTLI